MTTEDRSYFLRREQESLANAGRAGPGARKVHLDLAKLYAAAAAQADGTAPPIS
jgi:hypothetical protein